MSLRVALVGGPMYDHLYEQLSEWSEDEIEVVIQAEHPELNREAAGRIGAGERIDVLSTHAKYAPSQAAWLRPLDDLLDPAELVPAAVELCRYRGRLLSVPRCIDVRVLWVRGDRLASVPGTWAELAESDVAFGFPGRESGLFGTFFELVVGNGGTLFDPDGNPTIDSAEAVRAVELLCLLGARAPKSLPEWDYDEVDAALCAGEVDAAAAWPGGSAVLRGSADGALLEPHPYPAGSSARVSYAGCHSWGIPTTCGNLEGATELVARLIGAEAGAIDAGGGNIPANAKAFAELEPIDATDARRLSLTREMIDGGMITYPAMECFPEIEDAGWRAINEALTGERFPETVPATIQHAAESALRRRA